MIARSSRPFCSYEGRRVSLGDLSAGLRYTTSASSIRTVRGGTADPVHRGRGHACAVRFRRALPTDKVSPCVLSCGLPQALGGKKLDQLLDRESACQRRLIPGVVGIPGELRQGCEDLLRSRRHHGL